MLSYITINYCIPSVVKYPKLILEYKQRYPVKIVVHVKVSNTYVIVFE